MRRLFLLLLFGCFYAFHAFGYSPANLPAEIESCNAEVGFTSAKIYGTISLYDRKQIVSNVVVSYGTSPEEKQESVKAKYDPVNGFSVDITELEDGVLYYYQVQFTVGKQTIKGNEESFVTFPKGPVDLDLPSGRKWASCNVGATLPTENGEHFAWGETIPKSFYNWTSYVYCNGDYLKLTKYITNSSFSSNRMADNKVLLDSRDDVATKIMGQSWQMASVRDWQELRDHCVIRPARINGVDGVIVSSKKDMNNNKKFIFLPGTFTLGTYSGSDYKSYGQYMTSALDDSSNSHCKSVSVLNTIEISSSYRAEGHCTRAVYVQ